MDLIGVNGLAERWGTTVRNVNHTVNKPDFPEPIPVIGGGVRVWDVDETDAYRAEQMGFTESDTVPNGSASR